MIADWQKKQAESRREVVSLLPTLGLTTCWSRPPKSNLREFEVICVKYCEIYGTLWSGDRYRTTDELVEAERRRADRLAARLRELGELADG